MSHAVENHKRGRTRTPPYPCDSKGKKGGIVLLHVVLLLFWAGPVWPHGGEDHSHAAAPDARPIQTGLAAAGDRLEAVVMPLAGKTRLYLTDRETNAPLEGAHVVVETTGGWTGPATAVEPGVYRSFLDGRHRPRAKT